MYENENNFENMVLIQNENTVEPITDNISPQKINENVDFGQLVSTKLFHDFNILIKKKKMNRKCIVI